MSSVTAIDRSQLTQRLAQVQARYQALTARPVQLDMTRGKPCPEQLALSAGLFDCLGRDDYRAEDGTDCRNYGLVDGIPEARRLFAEFLAVAPSEIIVGGNSSLALMHDAIVQALLRGVPGGTRAWRHEAAVKFLCPSPGYDRHFALCEHLGIELVAVEMTAEGPDMDWVEGLVAGDPAVKGIWCVPKYSNPTGITYSPDVVRRLAHLRTAAPDFRIFWDNAYAVHDLTDTPDELADLFAACREAGHADRVLIFGSTSKVSFAGAGVAMVAASAANIAHLKQGLSMQTIGPDKLNQLRHVRFFRDMDGIRAQMRQHAAILRPKFAAVDAILSRELGAGDFAQWSRPRGGYFVSLDTRDGCAKRVVALAAAAGVKLTAAGASFPYGVDPRDRNIRIAPSLPSLADIEQAMELLAVCVQLASLEQLVAH